MKKHKSHSFFLCWITLSVNPLRWLPRVFTNNPSYQAYVTEQNLVTLSLRGRRADFKARAILVHRLRTANLL